MKKIWLAFITLSLLIVANSCDKELPYPIDDVKKGVLIDIVRVKGTNGVLTSGDPSGNYKIKLTIPPTQGDYSFMSHAQLLAVLQKGTSYTTAVAIDNITEFPKEIQLDIADVYNKLGSSIPTIGEVLYFTTNIVLKDGSVIPGWSEVTGFNNRAFAGWRVEERGYSYNVRYPVACELVIDNFVGAATVSDPFWYEGSYATTIEKVDDKTLKLKNFAEFPGDINIVINPEDHSVTVAKQSYATNLAAWGMAAYTNPSVAGNGTLDACNKVIRLTLAYTVDQGSFGSGSLEIKMD